MKNKSVTKKVGDWSYSRRSWKWTFFLLIGILIGSFFGGWIVSSFFNKPIDDAVAEKIVADTAQGNRANEGNGDQSFTHTLREQAILDSLLPELQKRKKLIDALPEDTQYRHDKKEVLLDYYKNTFNVYDACRFVPRKYFTELSEDVKSYLKWLDEDIEKVQKL